jgi:hypothetical protein
VNRRGFLKFLGGASAAAGAAVLLHDDPIAHASAPATTDPESFRVATETMTMWSGTSSSCTPLVIGDLRDYVVRDKGNTEIVIRTGADPYALQGVVREWRA